MTENTKESTPERKIYLLDDEECTPCEAIKTDLKDEIESGKIKVLQITSDEALKLLEEIGSPDNIKFPSALVKDDKGTRLCEIFHDKDVTLSQCGEELIVIRETNEEQPTTP
jgi:predicted DCC family thiol-disulfide oxidoreductase YuxK